MGYFFYFYFYFFTWLSFLHYMLWTLHTPWTYTETTPIGGSMALQAWRFMVDGASRLAHEKERE
jgi:hypothetical protein